MRIFLGQTECMRTEKVEKGYYCSWQIHCHRVFPVKYPKALFNEEVTKIVDLLTLCAIMTKAVDQAYHFLGSKWFLGIAV